MVYYNPSSKEEKTNLESQNNFVKELVKVLVSTVFFCGIILLFGLIPLA